MSDSNNLELEPGPTWRQMAEKSGKSIKEVKEVLPLEWVAVIAADVHLTKNTEDGGKGLCPFHADKNPSFLIYDSGERWKCFPCEKGGDVFDFIGDYWGLNSFAAQFEKALELLGSFEKEDSGWTGIIDRTAPPAPVPTEQLEVEVKQAIHTIEHETTKPLRDLLEKKGLGEIDLDWIRKEWRLGVNMMGEVVAPYWDREGGLVSLKTRRPDRGGWIAKKGTHFTSLYGEHQLVGAAAEADVWLLEGETDTWLASWKMRGRGIALGLPAGAGSQIRDEWVELMRDRRVMLCFDNDPAGRAETKRWWDRIRSVAREVLITFPESDLCDSADPLGVLENGRVVTATSGFVVERSDGKAYQQATPDGRPGEVLSNFVLRPTKLIDYRDSLGNSIADGFECYFLDHTSELVRVRSTDFQSPADIRKWAITHDRVWLGTRATHAGAVLEELQAQAPFLPVEIAVPVAGLWGEDDQYSVFVLPDEAGGILGHPLGCERWSFSPEEVNYDIATRYRLQDRKMPDGWGKKIAEALMALNTPEVMGPIIAWMTPVPLRKLVREFPPMAVLGASGSGKTTLTQAVMKLFWGWQGAEQNLTSTTRYGITQASAATNGLPVHWDEYRHGAGKEPLLAIGQVLRDSWTGSVSARGGIGDNLSKVRATPAIAPLLLSGEAAMEERSHIDRVVVVRLGLDGKNPEALQRINDHIAATQGGGVLGRLLIEWLLNLIDHRDPIVTLGLPARPDRQQQGEAVLEWGWRLWVRFANTVLGAQFDTDIDLTNVRSQRSGLDENPEITALWEALQGGFKEKPGDRYPVAWIHDEQTDVIAVRQRAFYRLASSLGYVLPGGEKGTIDLLKERYTPLPGETTYYKAFPGGNTEKVRALRLVGVLSHAREAGVEIEGHQPWSS